MELLPDPSHGVWDDHKLSLKDSDLWAHSLVMVTAWNHRHGPWSESQRWHAVRDVLEETLALLDPHSDVLFQQLFSSILRDRGWEGRRGEEGLYEEVHATLASSRCFQVKGSKVSFTRFFDTVKQAKEEDVWWHSRLYGMLCALLFTHQLDACTHEQFASGLVKQKMSLPDACPDERISMKDTAYTSAVKEYATNHLVLAAMVYSDSSNQDKQRLVPVGSDPARRWHSQQNAQCRSAAGGMAWLLTQAGGGFVESLLEGARVTTHNLDHEYMGFQLKAPPNTTLHLGGEDCFDQDILATHFGAFVLAQLGFWSRHLLVRAQSNSNMRHELDAEPVVSRFALGCLVHPSVLSDAGVLLGLLRQDPLSQDCSDALMTPPAPVSISKCGSALARVGPCWLPAPSHARRNLHLMLGWPLRSVLFLSASPETQDMVVKEFRSRVDAFERLKGESPKAFKILSRRSALTLTACEQLAAMLFSTSWRITPALQTWVYEERQGVVGSQIIEGGFHFGKHATERGGSKKITISRLYYTLLSKRLASSAHS